MNRSRLPESEDRQSDYLVRVTVSAHVRRRAMSGLDIDAIERIVCEDIEDAVIVADGDDLTYTIDRVEDIAILEEEEVFR